MTLTSMASRVKHAQALYRQHVTNDLSSDDLLAERQQDAARDRQAGR